MNPTATGNNPLPPSAIAQAIRSMAAAIADNPVHLIGIRRGGSLVADAIASQLQTQGKTVLRGDLDINFYRDDLDTIGPNPEVRSSHLPFDITDKTIWLIDDVLQSGRTIRAALGELFDYGRPAAIRLAILIDRGGRQLPIQPDLTGIQHEVSATTAIDLDCQNGQWSVALRTITP
ncbi:MAG: bifunctional pyr operon transcriptional regulator/uracil phosphoribosyltransferase PyrR [Mariprofundales bacterium]|nr:bifunctional pyr operon transcriptional regulator/uracil phosphoribosyltransferase PyrR [Mariprofundales bacterium]